MKLDSEFVRAVCELRERMGCAPTTGDVAASVNMSVQATARRLKACPGVFSVPGNPAPRWHVRGGLSGAEARLLALIEEAGNLVRGLDPAGAAEMRAQLLDALEGRR